MLIYKCKDNCSKWFNQSN